MLIVLLPNYFGQLPYFVQFFLVPSRQRRREPIRKNALSYLTGKSERDFQIRERELGLEERKIALEERRMALEEAKFEMEKTRMELEFEERKAKAEMDRQQFEVLLKDKETNNTIINMQQKLIDSLMYNKEK